MRLLLDTQALLWWLSEPERLRPSARAAIDHPDHQVLVSVVSLWEIVIKQRIGKLEGQLSAILPELGVARFQRIGIEDGHLLVLEELPLHHGDPFDRLLIAQAVAEQALFVSRDRDAHRYQVELLQC